MIYLDTHVLVWLFAKTENMFSDKARDTIENNELFISPIVILELEYLYEIDRISEHASTIISYLQKQLGIKICGKPFEEIIVSSLAQKWTRDPFDRIITAHAMTQDARLLTKDRNILKHYRKAVWD
ncbi:MAG: type II toxin-antitoxin system VapC family toxin [Spirochaetales bacterium]|jgi:PIN domain nuclease of toxin-antitoxin system|nr:type II toxin-antitoxin system VapC family toxin [Spirochaetales bacterium]